MGSVIGLDKSNVFQLMDELYDVTDRRLCYMLVCSCEQGIMNVIERRQKQKAKES